MRSHQIEWASRSVAYRLEPLTRLRGLLVDHAAQLYRCLDSRNARTFAEFVSSEPLALAESCKWHRKHAAKVLKVRRVRRLGLNAYLGRLKAEVYREPYGKVLIIGTWNYPVFLTGVQMLQALVTGNAVIVKPAPDAERVTHLLAELFILSGFPSPLIQVVDSSPQQVDECFREGVNLVVMTASSKTGRIVATKAAERLIPVIAELSGCDAMFVLPETNLERVAAAIAFGLRLNHSATCMAPRRVIIHESQADDLIQRLKQHIEELPKRLIPPTTMQLLQGLIRDASDHGATCIDLEQANDSPQEVAAYLLDRVTPEMKVAQVDVFAPIISILRQSSRNVDDWIEANSRCPYALTASIFGDEKLAHELARKISAGMITVNDLIAPTVEPSLSFGGRGESGFGVTRGEEGLRQMTQEKSIVIRRGNFLPHLDKPSDADEPLISGLFAWLHGQTLRAKWNGIRQMVHGVRSKNLPK